MAARYNSQNDNAGVRDSFSAEIKTLGSIRHKNIVKCLSCCWNHSTRLLMYEYKPNGSLGSVLHEQSSGCLEWVCGTRLFSGQRKVWLTCITTVFLRLFIETSRRIIFSSAFNLSHILPILVLQNLSMMAILPDLPTMSWVLMDTLLQNTST